MLSWNSLLVDFHKPTSWQKEGMDLFIEGFYQKDRSLLSSNINWLVLKGSDDERLDAVNDDKEHARVGKMLTSTSVDSLGKLVKEQRSLPALTCLVNAYRAACHSDSEITSVSDGVLSNGIQTSETFCTILMFMLHEADTIFRMLLGISSSSSKKEAVLDIKNTAKWLSLRPLIKST